VASGVVRRFVEVLMLSGDVMTPGLVKGDITSDLLCEKMAVISF
jgi:hypothetical protein